MTSGELTRLVKEIALEVGFDRVGIAPAEPPAHADFLDEWLGRGYAGEMLYIHRHREKRLDPSRLLPGAHSVIGVAMNYYQADPTVDKDRPSEVQARFARYAWGADYHRVVRERLDAIAGQLANRIGIAFEVKPFVDTAPVLERPLAQAAGLGWVGKNTLLIAPGLGSYVFLGGLITTLELEPDVPADDRCGRCRRCMDACPTGAIVEPHVLDARRCIAYLTIEHRQSVPTELRSLMGTWVFGCDICQQVCPHNHHLANSGHPAFEAKSPAPTIAAAEMLSWCDEAYMTLTHDRALRRANKRMLCRNAAIVLGNGGGQNDLHLLEYAIQNEASLVAEHARWAAERILLRLEGGPSAREPHAEPRPGRIDWA